MKRLSIISFLTLLGLTVLGQKITAEHQKNMLKMNLEEPLPISKFDSLTELPSTLKFNQKNFINDTIDSPIKITEHTCIYIEKRTIMIESPNGVFLFQIKKKLVTENKDGIVEYYYCSKGTRLHLITVVKNGIYIRRNNSYYSSFYYHEEL